MKVPHFFLLAVTGIALLSCETIGTETLTGLKVDKTSLEFAYTGGTETLSIQSSVEWTATCADSWCTVSPASGNGNADISVTAAPNPEKSGERHGRVIISYDNVSVSVMLKQEANPVAPTFSIDPSSIELGMEGGSFSFTVTSDLEYEITVVDKWISLTSREGDRTTGETITLSAEPNEWSADRSGIVSVCTKNGSCIPVSITQAGTGGKAYVHHNIGYRFTATWCGWCPYMDEAFHEVAKTSDFLYITFHASSGYPLYISDSNTMATAYKVAGYPTGILNGWQEIENYTEISATAGSIEDAIASFEASFPCVAGIAVNSTIADGTITVNASVETSVADEYKVTAFLLESGIVETQTYFTLDGETQSLTNFKHDFVARKTLTSRVLGEAFEGKAGESTDFSWSAKLSNAWTPANLSVAVIVTRPYGAYEAKKAVSNYPDNYVVNAVIVTAGTSKEIEYE